MAVGVPRTVDELASMLGSGYDPKTPEQIQTQAAAELNPTLRSSLLGSKQTYDATAAGLAAQRASAETAYDQQYAAQKTANAQTYSAADRQATGRGMGRSSYNASRLANVSLQGDKALNNIEANRANTVNSIAAQLQLAGQQRAERDAQYQASYQDQLLARIRELEDQEYQRSYRAEQDTNELLKALYSASGKSVSGGGSSSSSSASAAKPATTPTGTNIYSGLFGALSGGKTPSASTGQTAFDSVMSWLGSLAKPAATGTTGDTEKKPRVTVVK